MGILEVLTVIFIVLKCVNIIAWPWWLVLLPGIIAIVFQIVIVVLDHLYLKRMDAEWDELRRKIK